MDSKGGTRRDEEGRGGTRRTRRDKEAVRGKEGQGTGRDREGTGGDRDGAGTGMGQGEGQGGRGVVGIPLRCNSLTSRGINVLWPAAWEEIPTQ
jgi:hypothetical protein